MNTNQFTQKTMEALSFNQHTVFFAEHIGYFTVPVEMDLCIIFHIIAFQAFSEALRIVSQHILPNSPLLPNPGGDPGL